MLVVPYLEEDTDSFLKYITENVLEKCIYQLQHLTIVSHGVRVPTETFMEKVYARRF